MTKFIDKCFLCKTLLFPWWNKPARIEMYCLDGKIKGAVCKNCEKIVSSYATAMKQLHEQDLKDLAKHDKKSPSTDSTD